MYIGIVKPVKIEVGVKCVDNVTLRMNSKHHFFKFIGSGAPNLYTSTSSPALPPGQFNPAGMLGHNPQTSQYLPQIPYSTAGHMAFPGISQQSFPFLPPVSYCLSLPYLSTWLQNKNKNSNGCLY